MKQEDVTFLSDLWVLSWRDAMPAIDFEARRAWIIAFLTTAGPETIVADGADGVCGFSTREGELLHQLVVANPQKGTATARRLLDACKTRSPNGLVLDVNRDNPRAIRFYEREGFVIMAARRNPTSGLATWQMHWRGP